MMNASNSGAAPTAPYRSINRQLNNESRAIVWFVLPAVFLKDGKILRPELPQIGGTRSVASPASRDGHDGA